MKHERDLALPFSRPRASEFGVIVAVLCCDCAGTGTAGEGDACRHCLACDGSGEIETFEGETAEVGHG